METALISIRRSNSNSKMPADTDPSSEELAGRLQQTEDTLQWLIDRVKSLTEDVAQLQMADDREMSIKRQNRKAKVEVNINKIVNAIISWNVNQSQSNCRLRISNPIIKSLTLAMNVTNQQAIQAVMENRGEELELHHRALTIGERHNRRVDTTNVLRVIARDILKLDNWETIK